MNNVNPLKNLLDLLIEIRANMHDTVEPCNIEKMDEAIAILQNLFQKNSEVDKQQAMIILGKFFESIPSLAKLVEFISNHV